MSNYTHEPDFSLLPAMEFVAPETWDRTRPVPADATFKDFELSKVRFTDNPEAFAPKGTLYVVCASMAGTLAASTIEAAWRLHVDTGGADVTALGGAPNRLPFHSRDSIRNNRSKLLGQMLAKALALESGLGSRPLVMLTTERGKGPAMAAHRTLQIMGVDVSPLNLLPVESERPGNFLQRSLPTARAIIKSEKL